MSNSRKNTFRRVSAIAAPLAVAALALTACSPTHVTDMNSPTPSGSNLATPSVAGTATAEPSATTAPTAAADAATFFTAAAPATYTVKTIKLGSESVEPGTFVGVSVFGDPTSTDGSLLTTLGLCDGSVYTVAGKGANVDSSAGPSWNTDKCGDPADEVVAKKVHSILEGKLTAKANGAEIVLTGAKGSIALAPEAK